jgi:uncharacterized membrane protein
MFWGYHEVRELYDVWLIVGGMLTLLLWSALIWFIVMMFRSSAARVPSFQIGTMDDAKKLLEARLTAGEMTIDEYYRELQYLVG